MSEDIDTSEEKEATQPINPIAEATISVGTGGEGLETIPDEAIVEVTISTDEVADEVDTSMELPSALLERTPGELDAAYVEVIKQADPSKGDKDPVVIQWCRDNLSPEAFEEKYGHRGIV